MAISRSQMEEQIRGFREGGINMVDILRDPDPDPFAVPPLPQGIQDDIDRDLERLLQEEADRLATQAAMPPTQEEPPIEIPKFEERFPVYQDRLRQIVGRRERPNFYDLASTVGGAMLAADPTTGAFTSMGAGLAKFNEEERERRRKDREEDRAIAMQAFELAQQDESAARNLLNEYHVYKAKKDPNNEITFYKVVNPTGIRIGRRSYMQGDKIPLTDQEAFRYRESIEPTGSKGVKTPEHGRFAEYLNEEDAKDLLEVYGITRDMPSYQESLNMIKAPTPEAVGKPILVGSAYGDIVPFVVDGEVRGLQLTENKDAGTPPFVAARDKRLDELAKARTTQNEKYATILPTINEAQQILLSNQDLTGPYKQFETPAISFVKDVFQVPDEDGVSFFRLQSITNRVGPLMRPEGSGSTSDREFEAYKQAIASMANPALTNYISLYAFARTSENHMAMNALESRLLQSGQYMNTEDVADQVFAADKGVFEKYTGPSNDEAAIQAFYDSLPEGAVIINKSFAKGDGQPIFLNKNGSPAGPYIVKGWKK